MRIAKMLKSTRFAFWFVLAMLAMVFVPVSITLSRIKISAFRALPEVLAVNPSPHGYTVSLIIFIFPIVLIAFWFVPNEQIHISKRAFWRTIWILFPVGACLDYFFARYFFCFPNRAAVLGFYWPSSGTPVPIEEYAFYFAGFLAVLLFYIWLDGYWLHEYSVPEEDESRKSFRRLLGVHPDSLVLAALMTAAAIYYKMHYPAGNPGFPGYFVFLVLCSLLPSAILFRAVRDMVNWRALSLTLFIIVLVSLLWEATLALPYGWWEYQLPAMVGINVLAWHCLPIEAVFVWIAVTYMTVIVYEAVRCWQASGKSVRVAFLGRPPTAP